MNAETLAADVARLSRAVDNLKRDLDDLRATAERADRVIALGVDTLKRRIEDMESKP